MKRCGLVVFFIDRLVGCFLRVHQTRSQGARRMEKRGEKSKKNRDKKNEKKTSKKVKGRNKKREKRARFLLVLFIYAL